LGPDDQVVREHHDLPPHLAERELLERELGQAGVLVVAEAVLDAGALAVTSLQDGDVGIGLVGQDRLEAVSVVVGERQLRAGVGRLAPDDHPGTPRPGAEIDAVGELDDLSVLPHRPVLIQGRDPGVLWGLEDRGADRVGQLVAEGEPRIASLAVIGGRVVAPAVSALTRIVILANELVGICASDRSITMT
jgi:hypothetical protein